MPDKPEKLQRQSGSDTSICSAIKPHKSILDTIKERGWKKLPKHIKDANLRGHVSSASIDPPS